MAEYRLLTIWRIDAPLAAVYAAIHDSLSWPDWWPGVEQVVQLDAGDGDGIDSVRRYRWKGALPYRLAFDVRTTRIAPLVAIEGSARGDLEGTGCWRFSREDGLSIVRYEWHVRSTRRWMNLAAPLARPLFIRNHALVMRRGGESLARLLNARLVAVEQSELPADAAPRNATAGRVRQRGMFRPGLALLAGVAAGVIATAAQLALWWLAGMPLLETLFRDAGLTAAIVMGSRVLPPPATPQWEIMLLATLIHFALSVAYALIPAWYASRLRSGPALLAGAVYGLAIYAMNLYGFTAIFPWFAVARDWVTALTHVVFGMALAGACKLFAAGK